MSKAEIDYEWLTFDTWLHCAIFSFCDYNLVDKQEGQLSLC